VTALPILVPAKTTKHAGGRPSAYLDNEKEICELAIEMLGKGKTIVELAKKIGVNYSTVQRWKGQHDKFRSAMNFGDSQADEMVVNALFKRATGTATTKETKFFQSDGVVTDERTVTKESLPDTSAAKHWLKHRASTKERWKDVQTIESANKVDISIAISHAIHAGQLADTGSISSVESSNSPNSQIIDQEPDSFSPFAPPESKVLPPPDDETKGIIANSHELPDNVKSANGEKSGVMIAGKSLEVRDVEPVKGGGSAPKDRGEG